MPTITEELTMPTRNVVLTERQAEMVERLVESGRYQNASEVLREGLRLLEQRAAEDEARLSALRDAAQVGIDDFEAGRFRTFATRDALRKHLTGLAKKTITGRRK
jgi:antitoxin ParD1/3/4